MRTMEAVARVGEIDLCHETFGDPSAEPLLLVMGLGGPLTWWDPELCRMLTEHGFFVIRFDNRDTGRSTKLPEPVTQGQILAAALGRRVPVPYSLRDMAHDALGLLDHLGIDSAHVAGVSMGGMIGQTMAIEAPHRVRSLTSIMSTVGDRRVGWQHPRLLPGMITPRGRSRESYVEVSARFWGQIGSPGYPTPEEQRRSRAADTWDRGFSADGVLRQILAILTQPDRTAALSTLPMPVTAVHGTADPMVHVSGGRATARAVPHGELLLVEGMGHDLPPALHGTLVDAIRRTAGR